MDHKSTMLGFVNSFMSKSAQMNHNLGYIPPRHMSDHTWEQCRKRKPACKQVGV